VHQRENKEKRLRCLECDPRLSIRLTTSKRKRRKGGKDTTDPIESWSEEVRAKLFVGEVGESGEVTPRTSNGKFSLATSVNILYNFLND
jgi:hypothetical protein